MTTEIHGVCEPAFAPLKAALAANLADGLDIGASLAACVNGRPVVDLWAGHADVEHTRPWERDTIVVLQSATKIPLLICALMLVDRGLIALDAPVAAYWPAFGANGKAHVTIRDLLTHRSGVPALDPPASFEDHFDWEKITARIAAEPHWFGGEGRIAYSPTHSGFILGEVMRRTDGRPAPRFLREELAGPAAVDLQIGIHDRKDLKRLAAPNNALPQEPPNASPLSLRIRRGLPGGGEWNWERLSHEHSWPSGLGFGNGRALARISAIVANGGTLDGVRYLSEAMTREVWTEQVQGEEALFGSMRLGLFVTLDQPAFRLPSPTSCYWGGAGGSLCVMDPRTGLSFGFAMNNFIQGGLGESVRTQRLWDALADILPSLPDAASWQG